MRGYLAHTWEAWLAMSIFITLGFMIDERLMVSMWIIAFLIFLGALKLTYEYFEEKIEIREWNEMQRYNREYEVKTGGYTQSIKAKETKKEQAEGGSDDFEKVTRARKEEILRKMKDQKDDLVFEVND